MKKILLTALLFAAVSALPIQADFFQCDGIAICNGSPNADVMNGTPSNDDIWASGGNDILFGGDGRDGELIGESGDDLIFGGLDTDQLNGFSGNDIMLPGPDDALGEQNSRGELGNDTFIVLVSETVNCQFIFGGEGFDVLHLIGFGPYVAEFPYGAPEPIANDSAIVIQDPIAGGYIFALVSSGTQNLERINGLSSPNVIILEQIQASPFRNENCNR